jgi:steroid delta-isomerase-like uncharacterized protein
MSSIANKGLVCVAFEGIWNSGDLDLIDELYAPDVRIHHPYSPSPLVGHVELKQLVQEIRNAFPDLHIHVRDMLADVDRVIFRWQLFGTQQGQFLDLAPSGRSVTLSGITIDRIEDGLIVEQWTECDLYSLQRQIEQPKGQSWKDERVRARKPKADTPPQRPRLAIPALLNATA